MSTSTINIVGTVATEPRMITTQAGIALCTFRLASGERRYDRAQQKWIDGETSWFSVTAFRSLAEHAGRSFRKGERVIVSGRLRVRQWEKDERSGTSVDVEADALGHDLRWGVSRFEKLVRNDDAPGGAAESGANGAQSAWGLVTGGDTTEPRASVEESSDESGGSADPAEQGTTGTSGELDEDRSLLAA